MFERFNIQPDGDRVQVLVHDQPAPHRFHSQAAAQNWIEQEIDNGLRRLSHISTPLYSARASAHRLHCSDYAGDNEARIRRSQRMRP